MTLGTVSLAPPWLRFDLGATKRVLSWAINRPGFVTASRILWREVRNADLPKDLDVQEWLASELADQGENESVVFLTSRNIDSYQSVMRKAGDAVAKCVATVGLSNAERVGSRQPSHMATVGTINVAVELEAGLSEAGLIEALSIAVQARTAAIIDADVGLKTGSATGTGTDCVAIAAPFGEQDFTGLHTEIGEAIGGAVYDAVLAGAKLWKSEQKGERA